MFPVNIFAHDQMMDRLIGVVVDCSRTCCGTGLFYVLQVLNQLETLQGDPRKISMMMTQSEGKLKQVCEDLVLGVQEYRSEFEPDADDLIEKFGTIARDGYKAFLKIALDDKRVQNAIINALMDAMEEEQAQQTTKE